MVKRRQIYILLFIRVLLSTRHKLYFTLLIFKIIYIFQTVINLFFIAIALRML